jgi:hypothetical protein
MILKKFTTDQIILLIILLLAAFLRFYNFAGWSLSNDELSALARLQFESFGEMIRQGVMLGDFHPAGVQVFLWFWIKVFGSSVAAVRLPFVVFGIVSVYLVFLIGKRWFSPASGLFAASAMAFLQFPILYSQLARPYSPGLLFSLATIWFWTKIVFDEKRRVKDYAGFVIFAALSAYTHHYSFLFAIVVGLSGFAFYRKIEWKNYLVSAMAVGVLYLPHLKIFLYQFGIGGVGGSEGWLGKPEPDWILGFLKYAINDSWILLVLMIAVFAGSLILGKRKFTPFHWLSLSWFLVMFFIGYFYSIWRNPILQYSILLFSFPFLILFFFSFADNLNNKLKIVVLAVFTLFGTVQTVFINQFYQQQHFGEFKDVAAKIAQWNREFGKENVTNTIIVNGPFYIHYYLDKENVGIDFKQYENLGGKDLLELKKIVDKSQTPYFVHAWTKPCPADLEDIILTKYPCILQKINYSGLSEVTLYSKNVSGNCIKMPLPANVIINNFEAGLMWDGSEANLDSNIVHSGKFSYKLDTATEYSPAFTGTLADLNIGKTGQIKVSLMAFSSDSLTNMPIVISIENKEKGGYVWSSSHIENFIEPQKWGQAFFNFELPEILSPDDILKIYVWNAEKKVIYLDDVEIGFYQAKIQ